MPSWKKVITSGSDAVLNSVIATGSLDTINRELIYNGQTVLDWDLHQLAANGVVSAEWDDRTLYDKSAEVSIDWDRRQLKGLDLNVMLDWSGSALLASASIYMSASTQLYGTASYAVTASSVNVVDFGSPLGPYNQLYKIPFVRNSGSGQTLYVDNDLIYNGYYNILFVTSSNVLTASYIDPLFISASAAASGFGSTTESDPVFSAWSASNSSQFAGTASYVLNAERATDADNLYISADYETGLANVPIYWNYDGYYKIYASNGASNGIQYDYQNNHLIADAFSGSLFGTASYVPTLQQVTDQGNDTTAYITASGFSMFDGATGEYVTIQPTDSGLYASVGTNTVFNVQSDVLQFGYPYYTGFQNLLLTGNRTYQVPNQDGTILVTPWTGSATFSGSFYLQGLTTTSSVSNVLTFNPATGQVYYTASSAIGGGGFGSESDPIFTTWSGSSVSQFAGTSSFALTASLAPNYVLNTATSSFVLNSQTSSMIVLSSSFALTASFVQTALTSSFVTASNVFGPFGSNSIRSASYAVTASYVSNINAAGNDTEIQFNSNGILYATSSLTYLYASQSINHGNNKVTGIYSRVSGLRVTASSDYSQAEGFNTWVYGNYSHAEGSGSRTSAEAAHAEGVNTLAKKVGSHAEGLGTLANAPYQLTIGRYNSDIEANGDGAFIIGDGTSAAVRSNFFEVVPDLNYMSSSGDFYNRQDVYFPGLPTTGSLPFVGIRGDGRLYRIGKVILGTGGVAIGSDAISGGKDTQAIGDQGFSIGDATIATGTNSISSGKDTNAIGSGSLTTGNTTTAVGDNSVATGKDTIAVGTSSLATGKGTVASGSNAIATGRDTIASGSNSMTAGSGSKADAENSVAFGKGTIAKTDEQVVIGRYNTADTQSLFVVGAGTNDANRKTIMKVDTVGARIDGSMTISGSSTFTNIGPAVFSGSIVQAENTATGINALGFGLYNTATGDYSVTHGKNNTVLGYGAAAFGDSNLASGDHVLIHGAASKATADYSFASGLSVSSSGQYQHVIGKYNIPSTTQAAFIIGNGINNTSRSNLLVAVGNAVQITGSLLVSNSIDSNNKYLIDNNGIASVHWNNYRLYNSNNNLVVHWGTGDLYSGSFTTSSISWTNRLLRDSAGITKVDWENNYLTDLTAIISMDWNNRTLYDGSGGSSIGWSARTLFTTNGANAFTYNTNYLSTSEVYHKCSVRDVEAEYLSNTVLEYAGQSLRATIDNNSTAGELLYLHTDNIWYTVDQTTNTSTKLLGVNIDGTNVLLEGDVVLDNIQAPDYGLPLYIRGGGPTLSTTIPISGYVRVIGHCYHDNVGTPGQWLIKFRPSNDWYEI